MANFRSCKRDVRCLQGKHDVIIIWCYGPAPYPELTRGRKRQHAEGTGASAPKTSRYSGVCITDWDPHDNDIHSRVPAHRTAISQINNITPKIQHISYNPLTLSMIHLLNGNSGAESDRSSNPSHTH